LVFSLVTRTGAFACRRAYFPYLREFFLFFSELDTYNFPLANQLDFLAFGVELVFKYVLRIVSTLCFFPALIFSSGIPAADTVNYCHDEKVNSQWENLANSHSEPEYKELFNLRKELCNKVDRDVIDLDTAIDLFEAERAEKIEILRERLEIKFGERSSIRG
jgi:hypothetical protein